MRQFSSFPRILSLLIVASMATLIGCGDTYMPKPRGYFRIDLPEKEYQVFDTTYPYTFEYPVYAIISPDNNAANEPYWINIDYPLFKGRIHISYKAVNNNLSKYTEDAHALVMKHIPKASAIEEIRIDNEMADVHGLIYDIKGSGTASVYQFFITDSTHHFVRGALYFHVLPNNDSLAPVIDFVKSDIQHMLESFRWKTQP
ncbi:MAG: gliding motility lipoprotein GldD [Bacteroidetes bacterium HGW-Bacteroidetes-11]|jgi:gliding motility-associated lipoprotein GldD|nr:MAG: gliding motility lipoprotein GldD [Bacteroidetes bacterium HGW-Bacteroidetes-11]